MINENKPEGQKNKALPIIAIIAVLVLAVIVILAMNNNSAKAPVEKNPQANNQNEMNEPIDGQDINTPGGLEEGDLEGMEASSEQKALAEATEVIEGANKVSKDNEVLTKEGKVAKNNVDPNTPDAPKQSEVIENVDELPAETIRITMTAQGIEPSSFSVPAGQPISIAVTSGDKYPHIFKFRDKSLSAVAVGVTSGTTKAIIFQSPSEAGEYEIFCDIPGHPARGETAVMIVQ